MKLYEIVTAMHCGEWENTSGDSYETKGEAASELIELFDDMEFSNIEFRKSDWKVRAVK